MAQLYKKQAEDAEEKSIKLSEAITELQGLLKQATQELEKYSKMKQGWDHLLNGFKLLFYSVDEVRLSNKKP